MAVRGLLAAYNRALQSRPFTTQIAVSAALWAAGDALAQRLEKKPFQAKRFAVTTTYGALFNGTIGHLWYMKLDQVARSAFVPGSGRFVLAKVCADSLIFGPIHIAAFFTFLTLAEEGALRDVQKKLKGDFIPTFFAEFTVWPVVQAFNFWRVPVQYQLLVVNSFTIADAAFISWVQHQKAGWFNEILEKMKSEKKKK